MQTEKLFTLINSLLICGLAAYVALSGAPLIHFIQVYFIEVLFSFLFLLMFTLIAHTQYAFLKLGKSTYYLLGSFCVPLIILSSILKLPLDEILNLQTLQSAVGTVTILSVFGVAIVLKLLQLTSHTLHLQKSSPQETIEKIHKDFLTLISAPIAGFFLGVILVMVPLLLVNEFFGTSFYLHVTAFIPVFVFIFQILKTSSTSSN